MLANLSTQVLYCRNERGHTRQVWRRLVVRSDTPHSSCLQLLPVSPLTWKSYQSLQQVMPWPTAGRLRHLRWRTRCGAAAERQCARRRCDSRRVGTECASTIRSGTVKRMFWCVACWSDSFSSSAVWCWGVSQAGELSSFCFDLRHSSNLSKGRPNRLLSLFCLRCLPLLS